MGWVGHVTRMKGQQVDNSFLTEWRLQDGKRSRGRTRILRRAELRKMPRMGTILRRMVGNLGKNPSSCSGLNNAGDDEDDSDDDSDDKSALVLNWTHSYL